MSLGILILPLNILILCSELEFYLPTSKQSMTYALEVEGKGKGETAEAVTADCTLPLFGTTESSDGTTMFFAGGPVWAMDWLCTRDGQDTPSTDAAGERHLVLAAYRDYDEVSKIVYFKINRIPLKLSILSKYTCTCIE